MSAKKELKREIQLLEGEIKELEIKRSRSQASIIESVISRTPFNDEDVQFFRTFTAEIELKREKLQSLVGQLEKA